MEPTGAGVSKHGTGKTMNIHTDHRFHCQGSKGDQLRSLNVVLLIRYTSSPWIVRPPAMEPRAVQDSRWHGWRRGGAGNTGRVHGMKMKGVSGPMPINQDKWRNLNGGGCGSGGRRKARTSRPPVMPDRSSLDKRIAPKYKTMIYESLKYIEDPNGTDVDTLINFVKSKYELQSTFRKSYAAVLRALELKVDLKKVNDRYKVTSTSSGAETSRQGDVGVNTVDTREDPASVAIKVALAEINEYKVTKLCEDKNKLDELLDESVAMLMLAEDLHEQCKKYGSVTLRR